MHVIKMFLLQLFFLIFLMTNKEIVSIFLMTNKDIILILELAKTLFLQFYM